MHRFKRRPSPAMVVAMVALIAALAGTAIAARPATKKTVNKIITKRAPGLSVNHSKTSDFATNAGNANNASTLNNLNADALASAGAFDFRTTPQVLSTSNATVLSASITTPAQKILTAVATIKATSDGGGNDDINCNISVDGTDGPRQGISPVTTGGVTLPLTEGQTVGAGAHTVIAECSESASSATSVEDRNLNVVATG
jgi:hypothetical protein